MTTATATTAVSTASSRRLGHDTFPISALTSPRNFMRLNPDSDETADAFSSAKTFTSSNAGKLLLRFLMRRMLVAELAILADFQAIRIILLVLVGLVIAVLANGAGQRDRVAVRILGHRMHSFLGNLHKNKTRTKRR